MCILCVTQKCVGRVATLLALLAFSFIELWSLSWFLTFAFRFENTLPRVACVIVLMVTRSWYEVLMPHLSAWRVRRDAKLREMKRLEAIEMQKLRKTATRKCRNCLNPYKDQNPGWNGFMCSYCGHISKRPVLDLPVSQELQISNSGMVKDLVGKIGMILNSNVWSENVWMFIQDWLENGNWVRGSVIGNLINWRMNGNGSICGGDEHCLTSRSYFGILFFVCRLLASFFLSIRWLLASFFLSIRWLWRKISRISSRDECLSDAKRRARLAKRGMNGENLNESRGERARRKAEEKRLARQEKELWEEEERKQREEVAKLVEERRRLRDETMEAEKDSNRLSHTSKDKNRKKEAEKKRQERSKEKDKGSSKSNSDVEEMEKRASKESERKWDFDKKNETNHREHQKSGSESGNAHSKTFVANSYNRGSTGRKYLDRMRGSILSSSQALGFGKSANIPANVLKENKSNNSVDHAHSTAASRRDIFPPECPTAKSNLNRDDKNSVLPEPQPWTAPKKSWKQLFTGSSSVPKPSNSNVICRPNLETQVEAKSPQLSGQSPVAQSFDNPIKLGLPSPVNISNHLNDSTSSSPGFSPAIESLFSPVENTSFDFSHIEQVLFEDPCCVPDPLSLFGPISDSLDNFQLDLGSGFMESTEMINPRSLRNITGTDVNQPSPFESPLTREKNNYSNRFPSIPQAKDMHAFPLDDASAIERGTWQMWSSSSLGHEGLGLVGGPESWLLLSQRNVPTTNGDFMASVFNRDDNIISSSPMQNVFQPNGKRDGTFSPNAVSSDYNPWL